MRATDIPVPIPLRVDLSGDPINPMMFPHDWSIECDLETRWLTDVTQSVDQHEDRWALTNRPGRSLRARIVGATKGESEAILQSALSSASQFGFPVPIYPDASGILGLEFNSPYWVLRGDFSYRRFFKGARVAFLPVKVDTLQSNEGVSYATLVEVTPEYLTVQLDQGTTRAPTASDVVVPCMDVELVEDSSGTALTDSVFTLELEWNEVDGESSLPSTWPATSVEDSSVLEPLCTVIDGMGLFPFNPDWTQGVDVAVRRLIDSDNMGRTRVQDASGLPFHEFSLSVMGYDRPSCWKVARFFDSHRGRAASFWFEHPMKPFVPTGWDATSAQVGANGAVSSTGFYVRFLIFTGLDGSKQIRSVDSVSEVSGQYLFDWTGDLTDLALVDIQPVFVCRFDQDSLSESWNTNTVVPSLEMKIVEEPQLSAEVTLSGDLGYQEELTPYTEIPDCNLLLSAGANSYDSQGKPCLAWPSVVNNSRTWKDSRLAYGRDGSPAGFQAEFYSTDPECRTVMPLPSFNSNGQPYLINPYHGTTNLTDSNLPAEDRQLWSTSAGWTISFVITAYQKTVLPGNGTRTLIQLQSGEFSFTIAHDTDLLANGFSSTLYIGATGFVAEEEIIVEGSEVDSNSFTLRAGGSDNGDTIHLWINGVPAIASGVTAPLADITSLTSLQLFTGFVSIVNSTSEIASSWTDGNPGAIQVLSYKRALSTEEIDAFHLTVANKYLTPMQPVVLF